MGGGAMHEEEEGFSRTSCISYPPLRSDLHKRKPFAYFADWVCALRANLGLHCTSLAFVSEGCGGGICDSGISCYLFLFLFL